MPTIVGWSLPDGDTCSGHSTMIGVMVVDDGLLLSHEDLNDVVEPMMVDGDCGDGASLLMM